MAPPYSPHPQPGVWRVALLLTATIFCLLLFENRQYLFSTPLYENTDHAADSLLVRDAKHTFLLHGHYSQWRFYHPGPALLDTLAAGEMLFHDRLRLVPTPYNGQIIMLCLVTTLFFSLALSIFAARLGRTRGGHLFFLPLALLFAVWHYGAVGGQIFLDAWPAYPPITALLCFLVAAAAVTFGDGWQLPVLVMTGGWLAHNHVAQPLFVVPLTLLAYGGLLIACRQGSCETDPADQQSNRLLLGGWRIFSRAHGVAAVLLLLFILPIFLDALHGRHSNLAKILDFLHTHHEPGKKLARSLAYFLTYGGHDRAQLGTGVFGRYSALSLVSFVKLHWDAYAFWAASVIGAPILFFVADRRPKMLEQNRFLRCFCMVLATAFILTLIWGIKQTGPMYFYNAYFNYSLYFCLALGLAAALAAALMSWTDSPATCRARPTISSLLWITVVAATLAQAPRFRVTAFSAPADAAMAHVVEEAAAALPTNAVCFVDCRPWSNWTAAVAVVLELERLGRKARVNDNWEIIFGNSRTIQHEKMEGPFPVVRWMVASPNEASGQPDPRPLLFGSHLEIKPPPELDPNGQVIRFAPDGDYEKFAFCGWSPGGDDWAWSDQRTALIIFRPVTLPAGATGVNLLVSAWTSPPPGKTNLQKVVVRFNDATLDTLSLPLGGSESPPLQVRISAKLWWEAQDRGEARLQFYFPDAKSPFDLDLGSDTRLLGGGFRRLEFRLAP